MLGFPDFEGAKGGFTDISKFYMEYGAVFSRARMDGLLDI